MKKFLFFALALAGFAACSTDSELNETIVPEQKETFTIFATQQNFDDTRVSISADASFHPTVLTWDEGDQINLVTESGISVKLSAEDVEGKSATFRTTESVGYVKNDTYYACYPESQQISTTQLLYTVPATQTGLARDAVVLYGTGDADAETEGVQMTFKPVNSVLFISVDKAPAEGFSKLEISDYDGKQILSGQVTFYGETTTTSRELVAGGTITINGTEANNYLKSVYVSLPGGVSFETGYILTYTTQSGTVMSFAFNAGTLKVGYIYEAQVKWTTPSVTLGAKTTYSYASTDPKTANSMGGGAANGSGTTIFFNADYKSTISGVQNAMIEAMIEDCGFIVDGTTYSVSNGQVTREGKDFYMADLTNQSKADHSVQAFIKIKHNDTIITSAPETLSVTGIPYSVEFYGTEDLQGWYGYNYGWRADFLDLLPNANGGGCIVSPAFNLPKDCSISYHVVAKYYKSAGVINYPKSADMYIGVGNSSTSAVKTNTHSGAITATSSLNRNGRSNVYGSVTMNTTNKYFSVSHNNPKRYSVSPYGYYGIDTINLTYTE